VSEVASRSELELCEVSIGTLRVELGEGVSSIWPRAHKRAKGNGFGGKVGENVKRVSRVDVREVRDYSNAVPSVRNIIRGHVDRGSGMRKSRGRVRTQQLSPPK